MATAGFESPWLTWCGNSRRESHSHIQHGFTTRKDGHGFGLHSGALAARELGGSLNVQSDGAGKGPSSFWSCPWEWQGANMIDANKSWRFRRSRNSNFSEDLQEATPQELHPLGWDFFPGLARSIRQTNRRRHDCI